MKTFDNVNPLAQSSPTAPTNLVPSTYNGTITISARFTRFVRVPTVDRWDAIGDDLGPFVVHFCTLVSRIIAIGDIHGCCTALHALLREIRPTLDDTVIGLGDYVDRGPESDEVLETLVNLVTDCRFVPLIGNHEIMMYKALQNGNEDFEFWLTHGGNSTLASYGGRVQNIPQHHMSFLSHCVRFFETENHFFVHANYDPDIPLPEQTDDMIFWQHVTAFPPGLHENRKVAIVGHTPQEDGEILDFGHLKVIDTFCYGDRWLTALDVTTGKYWQANNAGQLQTGQLDEQEEFY